MFHFLSCLYVGYLKLYTGHYKGLKVLDAIIFSLYGIFLLFWLSYLGYFDPWTLILGWQVLCPFMSFAFSWDVLSVLPAWFRGQLAMWVAIGIPSLLFWKSPKTLFTGHGFPASQLLLFWFVRREWLCFFHQHSCFCIVLLVLLLGVLSPRPKAMSWELYRFHLPSFQCACTPYQRLSASVYFGNFR